jgi:hypothetical protein
MGLLDAGVRYGQFWQNNPRAKCCAGRRWEERYNRLQRHAVPCQISMHDVPRSDRTGQWFPVRQHSSSLVLRNTISYYAILLLFSASQFREHAEKMLTDQIE